MVRYAHARGAASCLAVIIVAASLLAADAKHVSGSAEKSGKDVVFLGKFCFNQNVKGKEDNFVDLEIETQGGSQQYIELLPDTAFLPIWNDKADCSKFHEKATSKNMFSRALTPNAKNSLKGEKIGAGTRARFWFVFVTECGGSVSLKNYDVTFRNGGGNTWSHFGNDESGLLPLYIVMMIMSMILLAVWMVGLVKLRRTMEYVHPVIKAFTIVLCLEVISLLLWVVHWAAYGTNGEGIIAIKVFAQICDFFSIIVFTMFLIMLAKGWTITTTILTQKLLLLIVFCVYTVVSGVLLICLYFAVDRVLYIYEYETVVGYLILVIRVLTFFWFALSLIWTVRNDNAREKRGFFAAFGTIFSLWFLSVPFIVFIMHFVDDWVRMIVVSSVTRVTQLFFMSLLIYLFWPSHAEYYFRISATEYLRGRDLNEDL